MMIVVVALMLSAADAPAPVVDDSAFLEGQRLYRDNEYEQAIVRLQEASLIGRGDAEQAQVLVWLGLAQAALGDTPAARRSFREAFLLDAAVAPSIEVSPKVEAELTAVRAEVAADVEASRMKRAAAAAQEAAKIATAAPAESGGGVSWWLVGAVAAAGASLVVVGGITASLAAANDRIVNDLETFQDDAAIAQADRDAQVTTAAVLFGAGAVFLAGGGALIAFAE